MLLETILCLLWYVSVCTYAVCSEAIKCFSFIHSFIHTRSGVLYDFGRFCPSVCMSVCLSQTVCLSVCLSVKRYLSQALTSHIRYSCRQYGSSWYMKVIESRSRPRHRKRSTTGSHARMQACQDKSASAHVKIQSHRWSVRAA